MRGLWAGWQGSASTRGITAATATAWLAPASCRRKRHRLPLAISGATCFDEKLKVTNRTEVVHKINELLQQEGAALNVLKFRTSEDCDKLRRDMAEFNPNFSLLNHRVGTFKSAPQRSGPLRRQRRAFLSNMGSMTPPPKPIAIT